MEKYVEELLVLAKSFKVQERTYAPAILFEAKEESDFGGFLINHRLKPFLTMLILDLVADKEFVIGHGETTYTEPVDEEHTPQVHEYGATLVNEKFDGGQVFQYLLDKHGFNGVIPENPALVEHQVRLGKHGHFTDEWYESLKQEVLIALDGSIIIDGEYVYLSDETLREKITGLITFHQPHFKDFLKKHEDVAIPHRMYLNWFMEWFPKRIHLGQIDAD